MINTRKIKEYINNNSTTQDRVNSSKLVPKLIQIQGDIYNFSCSNYEVSVEFIKLDSSIKTNCSCSNRQGICKHIVATLNKIIVDETKKTTIKEKTKNPFIIKLDDGLLTKELIQSLDYQSEWNSYSNFKITKYTPTEINVELSTFYEDIQFTIIYNNEIDSIEIKNNKKRTKLFENDINILLTIHKVYGENLFQSNYLEQKIQEFIFENKLTIKKPFDYFDFEVSEKGFQAISKFPNLFFSTENQFNDFPEIDQPELYIPNRDIDNEFGLGFAIKGNKSKLDAAFLFVGKWNKKRDDFSSKLEILYKESALKNIKNLTQKENQIILDYIKSLDYLQNYGKNSIQNYKKFWDLYFPIIKNDSFQTFYFYNERENFVRKHLEPFTLKIQDFELFFILIKTEKTYRLKAKFRIGETSLNLNSSKLSFKNCFVRLNNEFYLIDDFKTAYYVQYFYNQTEINFLPENFDDFNKNLIQPISKYFRIDYQNIKEQKIESQNELQKQVYIKDNQGYIEFKLVVQYDQKYLINIFSQEKIQWIENDQMYSIQRNDALEDEFMDFFKELHPSFKEQEFVFFLTPEELIEKNWMFKATEKLKHQEVKIFGANELKSFKYNIHKPKINYSMNSDSDWFDINIDISFDKQKVNLRDLQKAILRKSNYVELGDGTLGILPEEWIKKFENYFRAGEVKKDGIKLSKFQFGIIDELFDEMNKKPPLLLEMMEKKQKLANLSQIQEIKTPKGIKAKLRDYQLHGVNWLSFLSENQLGGCLADDMGLGKTLQTITFLQHLKITKKSKKQHLIIAPTSLIFNWKNEFDKFCPTIKFLIFTGLNRYQHKENFEKYDVIITTYGSILNDIEFLQNIEFHYIILDESQAIKNPNSKRYKACRLLKGENRLVLTGTPIENNTFDLYSQMNFINPGLLGSMQHFKKEFAEAIDRDKNYDASKLLSKMISPFMLRRTKKQVATELPEKTESIIYCEMEPQQRKIYEAYKIKYRDSLLNQIESEGIEKSQMYILEGLMKLRQICNSTALINDDEDYGDHSTKLDILMENILQKTGNHKILVFSQFVQMLKLIEKRFQEEEIQYEYLDGKTQNRQEKVDNFQTNEKVRVFLISLKAGGTGLNLTEADYVFLVDPWWNPAVENQAIDRCYRIGQTRNVMAYRMICKDTIEEKIVKLQDSKKAVSESIIQIDESKKKIDIQSVKELFG